jgi:3-oxoacyl-[acyl-carrier protein] reductase
MQNRIAVVTGASRGIGRACALELARAGARVAVAARNLDKLEQVAAEIRAAGGDAFVVAIDLASPESIRDAFARVSTEFGPVNILVNNGAITRDGLALRMKPDDWDSVLDTNLRGAFLCIQHVLQAMMRERWGRIINISSVVGESGNAGQANYVASKAGLIGLTKAIAQEMGSRNITVNAVAPGFIETDMSAAVRNKAGDLIKKIIPMKRVGTPEDIARVAVFLASSDSAYITGQVITVDGGLSLGAVAQ